jgi:hypothetical protein
LCEDGEDEFVIVLEAIGEVLKCHDGILHFLSEECFFEKVIELDFIQLSDDEYINDIVRGFIAEIKDPFRDSDEIKGFPPLKKSLDWLHHIIRTQKHLSELAIDRARMIHLIIFFLVLFVGFQYTKCLQIHEFPAYCIDLFINITTEFTDKKSRI